MFSIPKDPKSRTMVGDFSKNPKSMVLRLWDFQSGKIGFDECPVKQNNATSMLENTMTKMFDKNDPNVQKLVQYVS